MTENLRWTVMVGLGACLLASAHVVGWVGEVLSRDSTGISWGVAAVAAAGVSAVRWAPDWAAWLCDHGVPLLLGLLGTVVGFMVAISGVVDGDVAAKLGGVDSALSTTVAGLVAHGYILLTLRVVRGR